jgi:hypothetical protein
MRAANSSMPSNENRRWRDSAASRRAGVGRLLAIMWTALLFSFAAAPLAFGQTTGSATLRVTVQDPAGALIPNATVTVTFERTGDKRTAPTSGEGTATFASLPPGRYLVRVESQNFKSFEQQLELYPSDTRGLEAKLEVGPPTETVTVTATAVPQIQTETGARESTITAQQIENLSVVGRSALELLRTQPGVAAPNPDDPAFQSVGFTSGANANNQYNVNGLRGENNNVSIDGSRVIDIGSNNGTIITANNDMVQEVKIQSSNYAAEFGSSGVQLTATTKGGGREFHGTIYDYVRHHKLNANDRSRSLFGIARAEDKYQYPGGNIGGPVLLPFTRFNRDRDRLFFFFGLEFQRQTVDPGAVFARVPTLDQRQGRGFTHQFTGQPFDLTPAQIDPIGRALINLYPAPNFANPTGARNNANYVFSGLQPINRTQAVLRMDYKVTDRTNAYVRLARESETQEYARGLWWNPSAYELPSHVQGTNLGRSAAINVTSVLSPTMTNEIVFSASKLQLNNDYKEPEKVSLSALGLQNLRGPLGQLSPYAPIALITSWGNSNIADFWEPGGLPLFAHNSSFSVTDNLTKVTGAHTMKFGVLIEQANKRQNFEGSPEGVLIYAPWSGNSTGDVFADIVAGRVAQFNQSTRIPTGDFRFYNIEAYAQDSWKAHPRLTVELGARFAYFPHNKELGGLGVIFDPQTYDRSQGMFINGDINRPNGFLRAATGAIPKGLLENPKLRVAPRLNVAWDVFGNASTVIRGGAGLFFNRVQGNYEYYSLRQPPNAFGGQLGINFGSGGYTRPQIPLSQLASSISGIEIASRNPESNEIPQIMTTSLSLARRLPWRNVLEVAYVGTFGRHLPNRRNINIIPQGRLLSGTLGNANLSDPVQRWAVALQAADNPALINNFRPFPAYGDIIFMEFQATSNYHSMQTTLSRQQGRFSYFATYTFSKALGMTGTNETGDLIDPVDARGRSYGVLPYDRTHIFNMSYNLELPDLARGAFRNWLTRGLLNGWQLSGITTAQSGNPIRLRFSGDINGAAAGIAFFGTNAFATNQAGSAGAVAPVFTRNPTLGNTEFGDRYFDLSAIQIPGFPSSGATIPPFVTRGPSRANFDVTLMKNFNFSEERRLQFRAGFFNLFNQAFPRFQQGATDVFNDIGLTLNTVCNVRVNGVPNGAGGTRDNVCDPTKGFSFTQDTVNNFGRITSKHGHRVVELAVKFYF